MIRMFAVLLLEIGRAILAPAPPYVRSHLTSAEIVHRAEDALVRDRLADYSRPMSRKSHSHPETARWFHELCLRGDHSACRTDAWLSDPDVEGDGSEFEIVADECRSGDLLSCRALPADRHIPLYSDLPGATSRSAKCHTDSGPTKDCDESRLVAECEANFELACFELRWLNPRDASTTARGMTLANESCLAGNPHICIPFDHDEVKERACKYRDDCFGVSKSLRGDELRDLLERDCQYNSRSSACSRLVAGYSAGTFAEPVPGRLTALQAWTSSQK